MEATYILNRLFPDRALHGGGSDESAHTAAARACHQAILSVLRKMREGEDIMDEAQEDDEEAKTTKTCLELAFMACFRKEDYSQLSLDHAKRIPELDLEYS